MKDERLKMKDGRFKRINVGLMCLLGVLLLIGVFFGGGEVCIEDALPLGLFMPFMFVSAAGEEDEDEVDDDDDLVVDLGEDEEVEPPPEEDKGDELPEIEGMTAEQIQAYAGKKPGELIKMLHDSQGMINKQGNELGTLRKKGAGAVAEDSARGKYAAKGKEVSSLEKELAGIDKIMDGDKHREVSEKLSKAGDELKELESAAFDERVAATVQLTRNQERAEELSAKLTEDYGLQLSADEWQMISDGAISNNNGKLQRNHMMAELMRQKPELESLLLAHGGTKARAEISKASGKSTPGLPGKTVSGMKKVNLSKLSKDQRAKVYDGMSNKALDALIEKNLS